MKACVHIGLWVSLGERAGELPCGFAGVQVCACARIPARHKGADDASAAPVLCKLKYTCVCVALYV